MNLQPLYDLKDRLEQAAVAGTALMEEDFRLKKAAEALAPLAQASPVFAKISAGQEKLLSAPAEDRGGLLLDLLALVNAVAYTQGRTGTEGELETLPAGNGQYLELSRAQLQPLLEALTGTGGGRLNVIRTAWEDHPEMFGDFRVLPTLVEGLGESYVELAGLNYQIAAAQGRTIVPLLKDGFDPAGKKTMAQRARLVDTIAGGTENGWYLEHLPQSKKEVREALIYALRHCPENWERLTELFQTEKKDCRNAALWALARMDTAETLPFWRALAEKDPDAVLEHLCQSPTKTAAYLVADLFSCCLAHCSPDCLLDEQVWDHIRRLLCALDGKTGPEIWQAYRDAAALDTALDRDVEVERSGKKKKEHMVFWCAVGAESRPFSQAVPNTLLHSIQITRDKGLCALANELFERYGGVWAAPALCAALFTRDSEGAYRRAEEILQGNPHLFSLKKPVDKRSALQDTAWALLWNKDTGEYEYLLSLTDYATVGRAPQDGSFRVALSCPLDPRWYELLMDTGGLEANLMNLARPIEGPIGSKLGKYLHYKATSCQSSQGFIRYTNALIDLGWTGWDGYWAKWVQTVGEVDYYTIQPVLCRLPIPGREKAAQLQAVTDLIWAKKVKARRGFWPDAQIRQFITEWMSEKT